MRVVGALHDSWIYEILFCPLFLLFRWNRTCLVTVPVDYGPSNNSAHVYLPAPLISLLPISAMLHVSVRR